MVHPRAIIGELRVDGVFECFTLADVSREGAIFESDIFVVKVPGAPAIPAARYRVGISFSSRFQRELPEVLNVPNCTGIRIHTENIAADTERCVLLGRARGVDRIMESRLAFVPLLGKIREGPHAGPVDVTVVNVRG